VVGGGALIYQLTNKSGGRAAATGNGPNKTEREGNGTTPPPDPNGGKNVSLPGPTGPIPRRVLAVSVSNYLYANPTNYGVDGPQVKNIIQKDIHSLLNKLVGPS